MSLYCFSSSPKYDKTPIVPGGGNRQFNILVCHMCGLPGHKAVQCPSRVRPSATVNDICQFFCRANLKYLLLYHNFSSSDDCVLLGGGGGGARGSNGRGNIAYAVLVNREGGSDSGGGILLLLRLL